MPLTWGSSPTIHARRTGACAQGSAGATRPYAASRQTPESVSRPRPCRLWPRHQQPRHRLGPSATSSQEASTASAGMQSSRPEGTCVTSILVTLSIGYQLTMPGKPRIDHMHTQIHKAAYLIVFSIPSNLILLEIVTEVFTGVFIGWATPDRVCTWSTFNATVN